MSEYYTFTLSENVNRTNWIWTKEWHSAGMRSVFLFKGQFLI